MFSKINPVIQKLGYPSDARLVIFHADDLGMTRSSNQAFLALHDAGIVKCGSIMLSCPWAADMIAIAADRPELDLGVHLALTCEFPNYRWGPMAPFALDSGLVMNHGRFWQTLEEFSRQMQPSAAITEMTAQVAYARTAGLNFTHIDTHMGSALIPELAQHYLALGIQYGVPLLITRHRLMQEYGAEQVEALESQGIPLVDDFRITLVYSKNPPVTPTADAYEAVLRNLPAGIFYFSLHPDMPGDIEVISPNSAAWRIFEHEYFQSERLRKFLEMEGIIPIGYREICALMRSHS